MQTGELRFNFNKLQELMARATEKARDGAYKNVSAAIIDALPELVATLRNIVVSPEASVAQRLRCVELLCVCWSRTLKHGLREKNAETAQLKHRAKKAMSDAQRIEAAAKDKQARIKIAAEQKKVARKLARLVAKEKEKTSEQSIT